MTVYTLFVVYIQQQLQYLLRLSYRSLECGGADFDYDARESGDGFCHIIKWNMNGYINRHGRTKKYRLLDISK